MTIQEMVDALESPATRSIWWELEELTDENKIDEAVACIQKQFDCDREVANQVFIGYKKQVYSELKKIEAEARASLTPEQIAHNNAAWRDWLNNKPKCPICQSTNLKKISNWSKSASAMVWGVLAAGRVSKTWHCNNCDSEW